MAKDVPLVLVGSIATAVLICGALAQLTVGRLVERIPPHFLFASVTALGFAGNLWATYANGVALMIALAIAIAAIYGQVTVNDIILARYTADAWRGRVYAVRYFLLFISAGIAIAMISLLHEQRWLQRWCWRPMPAVALADVPGDASALVSLIVNIESRADRAAAGGMIRTTCGIRSSTLTRMRFFTSAAMRLRWHCFGSRS